MPTEERLLSIKEAAEVLNVSTDWLYRDRRWETLPFTIVLSPRKIRFSLQGLLAYIRENQNGRTRIQEERDVSHRIQS
jgi:predicted DNA-binding transcriptional regulator AlpA